MIKMDIWRDISGERREIAVVVRSKRLATSIVMVAVSCLPVGIGKDAARAARADARKVRPTQEI